MALFLAFRAKLEIRLAQNSDRPKLRSRRVRAIRFREFAPAHTTPGFALASLLTLRLSTKPTSTDLNRPQPTFLKPTRRPRVNTTFRTDTATFESPHSKQHD